MRERLPHLKVGDRQLSAAEFNDQATVVGRLQNIRGGDGIAVSYGNNGITISARQPRRPLSSRDDDIYDARITGWTDGPRGARSLFLGRRTKPDGTDIDDEDQEFYPVVYGDVPDLWMLFPQPRVPGAVGQPDIRTGYETDIRVQKRLVNMQRMFGGVDELKTVWIIVTPNYFYGACEAAGMPGRTPIGPPIAAPPSEGPLSPILPAGGLGDPDDLDEVARLLAELQGDRGCNGCG